MEHCSESKSLITGIKVSTPVGCLKIDACDTGLHHMSFMELAPVNFIPDPDADVTIEESTSDFKSKSPKGPEMMIIMQAVKWLRIYFKDPKALPDLPPVCLQSEKSTEFERRVWTTLAESATFGIKLNYGELAEKIGNPKAARAVGSALRKNPVGLIIPCHRVIRSDGTAGQYFGGHRVKKWLLEHEQKYRVASG